MLKRTVVISALLFLSLVCDAKDKKSDSVTVFPEVTDRGRALYGYDEAAWHASDAVQKLKPSEASVGRYIARNTGSGWTVAFGHLNAEHTQFLIGYEAVQGANTKEFSAAKLDPPQADTSFFLVAAKGIDVALQDFKGEKRPYNVAVLPAASGQIYVYVVPAQTKRGIYPIGGDVRYLISADGGAIVEKRQLHKSIIESDPGSLPAGTTQAASYHTHILSDVPEDTDVFHVLTRQPPQPEFVGTRNKKMFVINVDGTIREENM